ncbi:hypothetical protein LTS18_001599, partial [Coniosporium uncinatum]
MSLLRNVYKWAAQVNADDLDEDRYLLCKKCTELLSNIGNHVEARHYLASAIDLSDLFSLYFEVIQHPSLLVTIPALHVLTKLLRFHVFVQQSVVTQFIGNLLELCSQRLVRYEYLPEEFEDITSKFLSEDIDTLPEKHAFLGNYRRYCSDIIELVVKLLPTDATHHILQQALSLIEEVGQGQQNFRSQNFSRNTIPILRLDAQIMVVDATIKGFLKWSHHDPSEQEQFERNKSAIEDAFQEWCQNVATVEFRDPEMKKRVIDLLVTFCTKTMPNNSAFAVFVLDHILNIHITTDDAYRDYSDSVKTLHASCLTDLQKLAWAFPDYFFS